MARGNLSLTSTEASVGTSTLALALNWKREYALFVNDSDVVIYLMFGTTAELNHGIRIDAYGGSYEMTREYGNLDCRAVYAIAASGTGKNLLVTEG